MKSGPNNHWKDWCWNWNSNTLATWCGKLTHWKRHWCWERLKAGEERDNKGEMAGWHHQLDGHEFEQAPGAGDGQGGLGCCSPWDRKESDTTEWLNWTDVIHHRAWPKGLNLTLHLQSNACSVFFSMFINCWLFSTNHNVTDPEHLFFGLGQSGSPALSLLIGPNQAWSFTRSWSDLQCSCTTRASEVIFPSYTLY